MRLSAFLLTTLLASMAYARPNQATAREATMCAPPSVVASLNSCETFKQSGIALKKRDLGKSLVSETRTKTKKRKRSGLTGPSIELDTAARMNRSDVEARAFVLLQREVRVLERLVQNTPKSEPKRPRILLRLAETYFGMQQAVNTQVRELDEPIYEAQSSGDKRQAQSLRAKQKQGEKQLQSMRQKAIKTYAILVQDHQDFEQMDEVLFSLAYSLEELGEFDQARKVYFRLIDKFGNSPFVPHAYLSFAEYFFNDQQMDAAIKFYAKVTAFPPERNPVYGFALYKSAWAYFNDGNYRASLARFIDVIEFSRRNPKAKDAKNLARQAVREMVVPYAREGNPSSSFEFFKRFAKDRAQTAELQEKLAEVYYDNGQWDPATTVYRDLIARNPRNGRACIWQSRISNIALSSRKRPDQFKEVSRLIDLTESFEKRGVGTKELTACKQEAATILYVLATSWHREAVGTPEQPGTNSRETMSYASRLYEMLVERFPNLDKMTFPSIDKRDWPSRYRVAYFRAELLWKSKDWQKCGAAFDRVVELNPKGEYAEPSAYAAVLCYNNLYQVEYQARERSRSKEGKQASDPNQSGKLDKAALAKRKLSKTEQGMLTAFQRYVCFVPDSKDLAKIKYRRARIYYEANHFVEAAALFKEIVDNHRDSDLTLFAANLYLDSLNMLSVREPAREAACLTQLVGAMEPLWSGFCASDEMFQRNGELCQVVSQLRCDVMRKRAEGFQEEKQFKRAAATYVRIFNRYATCGRMDEVLYNAAINFAAARLLGRAIQVRKVLIARFRNSELAKKALFLVGANFHAMAFYEEAAKNYEEFARRFPREDGRRCTAEERSSNSCPVAQQALMNAVFFRLGLAQEEEAQASAKLFEKLYGRKQPAEASRVVYALGVLYQKPGAWFKAVDHYVDYLRRYDRKAYPHQLIMANMEVARAFLVRDVKDKASKYINEAIRLWHRGAEKSIKRMRGVDAATKTKNVAEARNAVSEALFYKAEESYEDFKRIRFPVYKGGRSAKRVSTWTKKEFVPWVKRKAAALKKAEAAYNEIAPLDIPGWMIAGAARIGEMYRSFVDEFRDAPIPKEVESDPELFDIYVGALDRESEPFKAAAESRFTFCLEVSKRERWFNKWSRQCELELSRLNPKEYPLASELRGTSYAARRTLGVPRATQLAVQGEDDAIIEQKGK